jgi:transposase/transposase-like protein
MPRCAQPLLLTVTEHNQLTDRVRDRRSTQQTALRARIVLLAAQAWENQAIAAELETTPNTVGVWRRRFGRERLAGLDDAPRSGRPVALAMATVTKVLATVTRPPQGQTRWSVRSMARSAGLSKSRVHQLWQTNDLKPHRVRTFKLSRDPQFEAKFWDVIGLYLHPPQKALVLCCDEKSQCQALERSQPGLPLGVGHIRTRTHDYVRHGTTTLFAALSTLDGRVLARTEPRHTHVEWLRFLRQIERETPPALTLHLIVDNYATHKHPAVKAWLVRHPRVRQHFTPTSSSWLNLVERFFRDLTVEVVREGSFRSVAELVRTIEGWLAERNREPRRYVWRAEGAAILEKIVRARAKLEEIKADTSRTVH